MKIRLLVGWGLLALTLLQPRNAQGQMGLTSVSGSTSLLSHDGWTLSADLKDSSIGLTSGMARLGVGSVDDFLTWKIALAAEKGKRSIFAKGAFVPGASAEVRVGRVWNSEGRAGGFSALYVSTSFDIAQRQMARATDPGAFKLWEETGSTASVGLGGQFAPVESWVLGLACSASWNHRIPEAKKPEEVQVIRQSGIDAGGHPITIADASERYIGSVSNSRAVGARFDLIGPRWNMVKVDASKAAGSQDSSKGRLRLPPTVAVLASASVTLPQDEHGVCSVAIGPGVFAPDRSTGLVGAILFELSDVTNADGNDAHLSDEIGVRVYVGVPWGEP